MQLKKNVRASGRSRQTPSPPLLALVPSCSSLLAANVCPAAYGDPPTRRLLVVLLSLAAVAKPPPLGLQHRGRTPLSGGCVLPRARPVTGHSLTPRLSRYNPGPSGDLRKAEGSSFRQTFGTRPDAALRPDGRRRWMLTCLLQCSPQFGPGREPSGSDGFSKRESARPIVSALWRRTEGENAPWASSHSRAGGTAAGWRAR